MNNCNIKNRLYSPLQRTYSTLHILLFPIYICGDYHKHNEIIWPHDTTRKLREKLTKLKMAKWHQLLPFSAPHKNIRQISERLKTISTCSNTYTVQSILGKPLAFLLHCFSWSHQSIAYIICITSLYVTTLSTPWISHYIDFV